MDSSQSEWLSSHLNMDRALHVSSYSSELSKEASLDDFDINLYRFVNKLLHLVYMI